MKKVLFFRLVGVPFQCAVIMAQIIQIGRLRHHEVPTWWLVTVCTIGATIVAYSQWKIYGGQKGLVTSGIFRITRHPMYTGFAILGTAIWYPTSQVEHSDYWISLAAFATGIIVAGWLQERETIARFGKEAVEYYRKTPRIAFLRWRR